MLLAAPSRRDLVLQHLEKILLSQTFRNSARLGDFLRHAVEQSLDPSVSRLTEHQIGIDVFDRAPGYDTRADPVVRVAARQLRFKLAEYYASPGSNDNLIISIPKGGYTARFEQRLNPRKRQTNLALAAVVVLMLISAAFAYLQSRKPAAPRPSSNRAVVKVPSKQAQNLYLQGRYYWNKRTPEALEKAVDYFTQAIAKDPSYAAAYSGLADSYNLLREYTSIPDSEAYPKALAAAKKAVELDDSLAEAHNSLAFASAWGAWDAVTANREFKRALALEPNNPRAHHWYATYLLTFAHPSESLAEIEVARQLDPTSNATLADEGLILFYAGRRNEAVSLLKQIELAEPAFVSSHQYLALIYLSEQNYKDYLTESRAAALLTHRPEALEIVQAGEKGWSQGSARNMLESMLRVQQKFCAEGHLPVYELAATNTLLGKKQVALEDLQRAYDLHESPVIYIKLDPRLRSLHSDPSYRNLVSRLPLASP